MAPGLKLMRADQVGPALRHGGLLDNSGPTAAPRLVLPGTREIPPLSAFPASLPCEKKHRRSQNDYQWQKVAEMDC
jgi:hypothetical protein